MNTKIKTNNRFHQLPAGLMIGDLRTELFGDLKTKKVFVLHNGETKPFNQLAPHLKKLLVDQYVKDQQALKDLDHLPTAEALEQFAFCVYGAADATPDFSEDGISLSDDNFMCGNDCKCLKWASKNISVDGQNLTVRQIEIIKLLASDYPDKQIAHQLNITQSTLDSHKTKLFRVFDVYSKTGLITKAINQKIIQ